MIYAEFKNEINDLVTENLYQWDTYQTLKISGIDFASVAPKVHFANKKSTEALVVNGVLQSDGSVEVSIPNTLLAEKYHILAYIYTNTGLTSKTIKSITIPIIARLKPSEYFQPTDEDIAEIEAIELEAKAIIDGLTASAYSSTKTYKRPNIVFYGCDSYMCKSSVGITGINPTDTTNWQRLTDISLAIQNDAEELGLVGGETDTVDLSLYALKNELPTVKLDLDNQGRVIYSKDISVQNNGELTSTMLEIKVENAILTVGDIIVYEDETAEVVENGDLLPPYYAVKVASDSKLKALQSFNALLIVSVLPQRKTISKPEYTYNFQDSQEIATFTIKVPRSVLNKTLEIEWSINSVTSVGSDYPAVANSKYFFKCKFTGYSHSCRMLTSDLIDVTVNINDDYTLQFGLISKDLYKYTIAIHSITEVIE